jgi:hypothetical protein
VTHLGSSALDAFSAFCTQPEHARGEKAPIGPQLHTAVAAIHARNKTPSMDPNRRGHKRSQRSTSSINMTKTKEDRDARFARTVALVASAL